MKELRVTKNNTTYQIAKVEIRIFKDSDGDSFKIHSFVLLCTKKRLSEFHDVDSIYISVSIYI